MFHKRIPRLISKHLNTYSTYLRNDTFQKRERFNYDLIANTMRNVQVNSIEDWRNIRRAIIDHEYNRGQYNSKNIDAAILAQCTTLKNYDLGSSYISFLKHENIEPNLATVGKYFKLIYLVNEQCFLDGKVCPKDQEKIILKYYYDLRKEFPILDSFTLENAVAALSITSQWKICMELMKEIEVATLPNVFAYSALISAAFLNKEEDMAWQLLNEMLEKNKNPLSICFLTYLGTLKRLKNKTDIVKKLEKLFSFFQENDFKCDQETAQAISEFGKTCHFRNSFTATTYQGVCKSCHSKLSNFDLGDDAFTELKHKILKNVIVGKDIFVKTNPEELQRFDKFVQNMGKFDVVLDGLNIAYSAGTRQPPQILSAMVAAVVSYFVDQNKKILVLGRSHMNMWPKKNWGYITENATVFLTQNISQDDPYLLYCALNSGKDTIIVTRDLMRGHKFLLKNSRDKFLFNRWLSQRQYQLITVKDDQRPIFRIPPPFSIVCQKNGNTWHIPFVDNTAVKTKNEFHKTWLCFKFQ